MADQVYDFDAVINEIASDSERKPIEFNKGGETFTIPTPLDWPDELASLQAEAANGNVDVVELATAMLGADQWDRYVAAGGTAMKFMKFYEHVIGKPGESPAS